MQPLPREFYLRSPVTRIAKQLLGKLLITNRNKQITSGIIVETEAYSYCERGCHAYLNRKTARNEIMFESGGNAYVYLCYGIYHLFNVVTNSKDKAEAVLIRALQPHQGEKIMMKRMNTDSLKRITSGPGKLTKALGIDRTFNAASLLASDIWIEDGIKIKPASVVETTRVGIDYAGADALLPWRYYLKDNEWVSKR